MIAELLAKSPLVGAMYGVHLTLIGKPIVNFLFVLIEFLFAIGMDPRWRYGGKAPRSRRRVVKIIRLLSVLLKLLMPQNNLQHFQMAAHACGR